MAKKDEDARGIRGQEVAFRERKRWLVLGLPWTFTVYRISNKLINVSAGFLSKKEDDCYMYKITDVRLERSFLERLVGVGTVSCYSADVTDPTLVLKHVKHCVEIKDFILEESDRERIARRTVNMQDVGFGTMADLDGDGIPDGLQ